MWDRNSGEAACICRVINYGQMYLTGFNSAAMWSGGGTQGYANFASWYITIGY